MNDSVQKFSHRVWHSSCWSSLQVLIVSDMKSALKLTREWNYHLADSDQIRYNCGFAMQLMKVILSVSIFGSSASQTLDRCHRLTHSPSPSLTHNVMFGFVCRPYLRYLKVDLTFFTIHYGKSKTFTLIPTFSQRNFYTKL